MKYLLTFVLVVALVKSYGQNLVPNPSFEDTVACPYGLNQAYKAVGWSSYRDTPDYFNACANNLPSLYKPGVPLNTVGFQYAASGNAYCGLLTDGYGINCNSPIVSYAYREFIGSRLITPLVVGNTYFISMKVSLAEGSNCATNNIGVLFSTSAYNDSSCAPINNYAHVRSNAIISDSVNWVVVSDSFIADSAYQYIIIGNFYDDEQTDSIISTSICNAYYYIDDVCVSADSSECDLQPVNIDHPSSSGINIFPNPASNTINLNLNINKPFRCFLLTLSEKQVRTFETSGKGLIDVSDIPSGMYILEINFENQSHFFKQIIIH